VELCGQEERAALAVAGYRPPDREGPGLCLWAAHDEVFVKLKILLKPCGITGYYTDYREAYERNLESDVHSPGRRHTQQIERKPLTLRTRLKRLVRKTICFSKSSEPHAIVIGLFINHSGFGLPVERMKSRSVTPRYL
jgi:IS1 family transposase